MRLVEREERERGKHGIQVENNEVTKLTRQGLEERRGGTAGGEGRQGEVERGHMCHDRLSPT